MTELLRVNCLSKYFPGVRALNGVNFTLDKGKIYGLVGENGAGKSTLVKILMGLYKPDEGEIQVKGERVFIRDSYHARTNYHLDTIFQEHSLIPQMSIAENIFLDKLHHFYKKGLIEHNLLEEKAGEALKVVGLEIDVSLPAGEISEGEKRLVELARSLLHEPELLILDEMTAPLESNVVKDLFKILINLKAGGKTLIFISHRLEEVQEICDEIMVLKDGDFQGFINNDPEVSSENIRQEIIKRMTGKATGLSFPRKAGSDRESGVALAVEDLGNERFSGVNFEIHQGEIVALAGLRGQGQSELLRAIAGLTPVKRGSIKLFGTELKINGPGSMMENGIFYISDKRDIEELWLTQDVGYNISLPSLDARTKLGFINAKKEDGLIKGMIEKLLIDTPSPAQLVRNLSGGNRQKVVLGKYILAQPRVLLIDQPTMGLDIGAKMEIYKLLRQLAERGIPTLLVLTDREEILNLPDRILVMCEGQIVKEFKEECMNEEELLDSYYV